MASPQQGESTDDNENKSAELDPGLPLPTETNVDDLDENVPEHPTFNTDGTEDFTELRYQAQLAEITAMTQEIDEHRASIASIEEQISQLQMRHTRTLDACRSFMDDLHEFQAITKERSEFFINFKDNSNDIVLSPEMDALEQKMSGLKIDPNGSN